WAAPQPDPDWSAGPTEPGSERYRQSAAVPARASVPWSEPRPGLRRRARPPAGLRLATSRGCVPGFAGQRGLRRIEPGDRHPVGRAGDVVEADGLAKADRRRVAAMLAANAELQPLAGGPSAFDGEAHHLADPLGIERHERVVLEDPEPLIDPREACRVVARQTEDRLGQIVRAEAEEFRRLGDFAGAQCCARQLDHRPEQVRYGHSGF